MGFRKSQTDYPQKCRWIMFFGKKLPCGKLMNDGKPRLPRRFINFLFGFAPHIHTIAPCGICRFPQAGIPRQDSLTRIRTTANVVCRVDSAQGQQKTRSQHIRCWLRVFLVAPCGIEPQILPWEGSVLTAWPWGRKSISDSSLLMIAYFFRYCNRLSAFPEKKFFRLSSQMSWLLRFLGYTCAKFNCFGGDRKEESGFYQARESG